MTRTQKAFIIFGNVGIIIATNLLTWHQPVLGAIITVIGCLLWTFFILFD